MTLLQAVIFGIIQGLSEFLPISSTAHLTLAGKLLVNDLIEKHPEQWTAFMAVIQLGTLLAVLIYFRNDLISIIKDFLTENIFNRKSFGSQSLDSRMGWYIIIGTIPVVILGLVFRHIIEGEFTKNLFVITISLIVFAILLDIAEKISSFEKNITRIKWSDALIIGIAQAFALIPGSSRSGSTITAGLFLDFTREAAARFSFLLSIPVILASGLLELKQSIVFLDKSMAINLTAATIASFVFGYLAIDFVLKFLKKNSTYIFVFYRIVLGIIMLSLLLSRTIHS
ncbi:MAG: undecaprenyl-diphosphatase UppP [Ignavibacteria bacterium]